MNHKIRFSTLKKLGGLYTHGRCSNYKTGKKNSIPFNNRLTLKVQSAPLTTIQPTKKENLKIDKLKNVAPGICTSVLVMGGGGISASYLGSSLLSLQGISGAPSPISGIPCAIVLGMLLGTLNRKMSLVPDKLLNPGLTFSSKYILQAGIICVGAKLSLVDLATTGLMGLPVVCCSVGAGLTFIPWFGRKMGLSEKMGSLISIGTSICGVTAISALSPAIKANEKETSFAIANVVLFGSVGMLAYPYFAHSFFETSQQAGLFLGLAVHDTSQAVAGALTYSTLYGDDEVLKIATVTKLSRNMMLAGVIPTMTYFHIKNTKEMLQLQTQKKTLLPSFNEIKKYVPGFVLGFVGMAGLRTAGDVTLESTGSAFYLLNETDWKSLVSLTGGTLGSKYLLGTAMAALGLNTNFSKLKGVGLSPFVVGLAGSAVVGFTGCVSTLLFGNLIGF